MALGKRLINTGAAACTTDTADIFGDSSGVLLYSFDYDASDASGTSDGTPSNVTFGVGGQINYGARFNGSSSYIDTNYTLTTDTTFSFSWWMNVELPSSGNNFIINDGNGTVHDGTFAIYVNSSNQLGMWIGDNSSVTSGTLSITGGVTGSWMHFAVSVDGSTATVYKNGSSAGTISLTSHTTAGILTLIIGRLGHYSGNYLNGDLDQFRYFNKAISPDEVSTLYAETACVYTSTTDIVNYPTGTTPVAYYKLDNSSEDFSTGGNDGTETDIEYRFGRYGQAAVFNGSSSIIKDVLGSGFTYAGKTMTFSAWIFVTDNTNDNMIIGDGLATSTGGWGISTGYGSAPNTRLSFSIASAAIGGVQQTYSSVSIADDTWTHIVVSVDFSSVTDSIKMYINGTEDTSLVDGISGSFVENTTYNTSIGGTWTGVAARLFEGSIDQVRIYSTALSASQVTELYNEKPETDTSNFKTVLWSGTSAENYISQVGLDLETNGGLVWIKQRSAIATNHRWFDSIRGVTQLISSSNGDAEGSNSETLKSFEKNGFILGTNTAVNDTGDTFVGWCWKAGGDAVTGTGTGVTNVSISANTDAGFSIVKYTGSGAAGMSFGHGLTSIPELVIIKNLDNSISWQVFGESLFTRMQLNEQGGDDGNLGLTITSTTIQTTQDSGQEGNSAWNATDDYIAYIWHSVSGYSKIGTYEGLGTSTVTVSDVGFKPSFIMIKNLDYGPSNWNMYDVRRSTVADRANGLLYPNLSNSEVSGSSIYYFDMNDSGFVVGASNHEQHNKAGRTYLYMAFK